MTLEPPGATFECVDHPEFQIERPLADVAVLRRLRTVAPTVQDSLLALVLAATLTKDLASQAVAADSPLRAADPLGYVLVAMLVLPLALRRRFPISVFTIILVSIQSSTYSGSTSQNIGNMNHHTVKMMR